jgi:hypothetical protein
LVDERITFMLSAREMLYMAASKGMSYSTLIGDPFRGLSVDAIREEMIKGRTALEGRSMIRQIGPREWEVEGRLDGIFQFLVTPEYSLIVNTWRKDEENSQLYLHFKAKQGLSLIYKNGYYHLSLYRGDETLLKYLLPALGIGPQFSERAAPFRFPASELGRILASAWQKPEEVAALLRTKGLPEAEAGEVMGLIGQMNTISLLLQVTREGAQSVRQRQLLLFCGTGNLWWHESPGSFPEMITLEPIPAHSAAAQVRRLFSPGSGEPPPAPAQPDEIIH